MWYERWILRWLYLWNFIFIWSSREGDEKMEQTKRKEELQNGSHGRYERRGERMKIEKGRKEPPICRLRLKIELLWVKDGKSILIILLCVLFCINNNNNNNNLVWDTRCCPYIMEDPSSLNISLSPKGTNLQVFFISFGGPHPLIIIYLLMGVCLITDSPFFDFCNMNISLSLSLSLSR